MGADKSGEAVQTIGYIGLGNAGFSLASNLPKAGYHLVVHDTDPARVQRATSQWQNTTAFDGVPSKFKDCDIIITMLPQGKVIREVLLGEAGIAEALKSGTIVVDTSSSSPFDTQSLGLELKQYNIHLVDSPITQTYMHATDAGEATMMVGCDDELFARVKPVLQHMAAYIFHMGPLGSGHAMKTLNNYIMASSIVALNDSLVTGQKFGLDPQKMIDVLNVGTGVNFPTLDTYRRDVSYVFLIVPLLTVQALTRNFNSGFGLALLVKDLGITKEFMQHSEFQTDLPDIIQKYLSYSLDHVKPNADHTEALKGWEKRSGIELKRSETVQPIPAADFKHRLEGLNRP